MSLDDLPAGRKPKAGATHPAFGAVKRLENSRQLIGGNSAAGVANYEVNHIARGVVFQANDDAAAIGHGLASVDQQIEQHLLNLISLRLNFRHLGQMRLNRNAILRQLALQEDESIFDDLLQIRRFEIVRAITSDGKDRTSD